MSLSYGCLPGPCQTQTLNPKPRNPKPENPIEVLLLLVLNNGLASVAPSAAISMAWLCGCGTDGRSNSCKS